MSKEARNAGISILILASGFARRMRGADKVLQPVGGIPLLRRLAIAARQICDDVAADDYPGFVVASHDRRGDDLRASA